MRLVRSDLVGTPVAPEFVVVRPINHILLRDAMQSGEAVSMQVCGVPFLVPGFGYRGFAARSQSFSFSLVLQYP